MSDVSDIHLVMYRYILVPSSLDITEAEGAKDVQDDSNEELPVELDKG